MSWKHFQWARKQKTGCDRANHVLVHLAYLADKNGIVVVSIANLAEQIEMKPRTVQRALAKLAANNRYIKKERRIDSRGYRSADRFTIQSANVASRNEDVLHAPKCQNICLGLSANVASPLTTEVYSSRKIETFMDTYLLGDTFQVVGDVYSVAGKHYVSVERQK